MEQKVMRKGGSFLLETVPAEEVFTPEDFSEEHRMIMDTTDRFMRNEVEPYVERIEHKDWGLLRELIKKAGELGLLGVDVEERYGGSHIGSVASLLITERFAHVGSFGVTMNDQTCIGTLPLVFFGNKTQKEKYLPALAQGEKVGAYALTEPGAGSDALSIKTTAKLSSDGKYYILDGTKQFTTNGAIADVIFTYAKVDGDKFTAFILERGFEGISLGPEEKKMGLRGSSTCSIFLDAAKVPVENLMFEIGRGHIVAFNILNLGRVKLGAAALGAAKLAIELSVKYSKERVQFNRPICQFGLIKHKIAEMATRTYITESMVYRTGRLIDDTLGSLDCSANDFSRLCAMSLAEYAIECSICKVCGSEAIDYVSDEAIQILGGYGYIEDYNVERIYRDNRVLRIFEGTNEINRSIIIGFLLRKGLKNELPLFSEIEKVKGELTAMKPVAPEKGEGLLGYQSRLLDRARKVLLYLCGAAAQKYGKGIDEQQELLGLLADIAQEIYAMESGLLRALKAIGSVGEEKSKTKIDMMRLYTNDAMVRMGNCADQLVVTMGVGGELNEQLGMIKRAMQFTPLDGVQLRREVADRIIEAEKYTC